MSQPSTCNPANNDNMVPDTSKRVESSKPGASRHSPEHVDWGVDSGFNGYSTGNDEGDGEGHDDEVDDEFDDGGDDEVDDEGDDEVDDEVDDEGDDNEQFCDLYNNETNMNDNTCNDDLLNEMDDNIDDPDFIIEEDEDIDDNAVSPSNMMGGLNEHILRNKKSIAIHNVPRLDLSGGIAIEEDDLNEIATRSSSGWRIPEANFHNVDVHPSFEEPSMIDRELAKGVVIECKEELLVKVGLYHLKHKVEFRTPRSSNSRLKVVCKHKNCPFLLSANALTGGSWKISKFIHPHTCSVNLNHSAPRQLAAKIIGALFAPKLLTEGRVLKPAEIMGDMERDHGIKLKYDTTLRSQNAAYDFIYRDHKKSWKLLPAYFHMSMKENLGTSAYIETDKDDVFEYAFISFNASAGFLSYCRPVIVIDGTHLKGKYKGILFVATTKDGNEQIFPLAFGIGDKECHSAWMWFLQKLRSTFGCPENLVIVSDRHPSIKFAMEVVYPEAVHAICSYHLRQNIRSHGSKAVGLYMKV
ncbi:MuDR family transposase [Striga hermonthica]|uniref:MuDR family transposase n=1 Tax=Striga hermonthica TaxID=68872 RepID=A0A9N7R1T6_STRHE|nr:MuDR family transposase [Striga hermonthica]